MAPAAVAERLACVSIPMYNTRYLSFTPALMPPDGLAVGPMPFFPGFLVPLFCARVVSSSSSSGASQGRANAGSSTSFFFFLGVAGADAPKPPVAADFFLAETRVARSSDGVGASSDAAGTNATRNARMCRAGMAGYFCIGRAEPANRSSLIVQLIRNPNMHANTKRVKEADSVEQATTDATIVRDGTGFTALPAAAPPRQRTVIDYSSYKS